MTNPTLMDIFSTSLEVKQPQGGFYLWLNVERNDTEFAKNLYQHYNVTVLPGSYLGREANGINPGENHLRIALVASIDECIEATNRIHAITTS